MPTPRQRQRQRQTQARQLNAPALRAPAARGLGEAPSPPPAPIEHPAIATVHPTWWQVRRVERRNGKRWLALIAECRTETEAFAVADREVWQVEITKWGDRRTPYLSFRPERVLAE